MTTHSPEAYAPVPWPGPGGATSLARRVCPLGRSDLNFLARASAELARTADYEETLKRVAGMAVPQFADWCAVDMIDDDGGEMRRVAVAHVDPGKVQLA